MKLETQDDQLMALAAFRYSLGRRSYIVGAAIEWLRATWHQLDANTQGVILRDIIEAIIDHYAGDQGDTDAWSDLAKWGSAQVSEEKREWILRAVSWKNRNGVANEILGVNHG